jgi:hypothetical protein
MQRRMQTGIVKDRIMLKAQLCLDPKPIPHCWPENIGNPVFLAIKHAIS